MRYIYGSDYKTIKQKLLDEAFNLESGLEIVKNGKIIDDVKTAKKYPLITVDNVSMYIKPNIGFIYVNEIYIDQIIKELNSELQKIEKKFTTKFKNSHLKSYTCIERGINHFVSVKTKCRSSTNISDSDPINGESKRIIKSWDNFHLNKTKCIESGRFIWVIASHQNMLANIESSIWVHFSTQLVSIFADIGNETMLTIDPDTKLTNNMLFSHFKFMKTFLGLTSDGILTKDYILEKVQANDENYISYANKLSPEFIPGINSWENLITFCPIRYFDVEINKKLKTTAYDVLYNIFIEITKQIYEVDIKLCNISNNKCNSCGSALYDDIYLVFSDLSKRECDPFCKICMHSAGTNKDAIIARSKYKHTLEQALAFTDMDDNVKDICLANKADIIQDSQAVYVTGKSGKKYLLWSGTIHDYYQYINSNNYISRKYDNNIKLIKEYFNTVSLVKIKQITPSVVF